MDSAQWPVTSDRDRPRHLRVVPEGPLPPSCVIVPTRNEAGNVARLVQRLRAAFGGAPATIIFVDDSDDDTPGRVAEVATAAGTPVHLIHREPPDRSGGLGSAVLAGLHAAAESGADWAVVMDGDLQHPPEVAAQLVLAGQAAGGDLVVASRYVAAGSAGGLAGASRVLVSSGATRLSKAVFPRRLRECSDPMSGFFAVRLNAVDLARLRPQGFKILLEIVARSAPLRIVEIPFTFADRLSGESKASWREGFLFAHRLASLRVASAFGRHSSRAATVAAFAAVGATGMAINSAALWALVAAAGLPLLLAALLATQVSTVWNFALTDGMVFRGHKSRPAWLRFTGFALVNNAVLLLRLPLLSWLAYRVGMHYVIANMLTLLAAFAVRYVISDLYLFGTRRDMSTTSYSRKTAQPAQPAVPARSRSARPQALAAPTRSGPTDVVVDLRPSALPVARVSRGTLTWRYNIHNLVTIGSVVRLTELDHFEADADGPFDIEIRVGHFDQPHARGRALVTQFAAAPGVCYQEHAGRKGSDFLIDMTDNIAVTVGPMLMASPHVLYTNVLEALLRFVLVSRGRILLHSACLDLDGRGVLLSARTDTGKTGTVLRLLGEQSGRFLSDDMTILAADGSALSFPKPLTISQHTLRAVDTGRLTGAEWRWLRVQSRLHSKQGRGIGTRLGEMNVPIMSLNAVTQWVVPPPKYTIQRLVPCEEAATVRVEELFVIERGQHRLDPIEPDGLVDELIDNTDDAYGFPPFRYFAPALVIGGQGYEELRARERSILSKAMGRVRARRLVTPDFTWADRIPELVAYPVMG